MASALLIRETERADETPTVELDPPTGGRWDDVLPILAHELRAPLTALASSAEILHGQSFQEAAE